MDSIAGYDAWKTASPYDNENEWDETITPTCDAELDYCPDDHICNDNCAFSPEESLHVCGSNEKVTATCVGNDDDYTRYWSCISCGTDYEEEVRG